MLRGEQRRICIFVVGDPSRDSRCLRFARTFAAIADVRVVSLGGNGRDEIRHGVRFFSLLPPNAASLRSSLSWFWRASPSCEAARNCHVYLASDLYALPAAARAAGKLLAPLLYDSRELYPSIASLRRRPLTRLFWRFIEWLYVRGVSVIFTVNESIASALRERYPTKRVEVVHNYAQDSAVAGSASLRGMLGIPDAHKVLLSLGGVQEGRGARIYIRMLARLENASLVFLGPGETADLHALAERCGVAERVHFPGAVDAAHVVPLAKSADIGLCVIENLGKSYYHSLPNKLFEYFAAGLPVVASDFPEIGAIIRGTGAGVLVDPNEEESVYHAVAELLENPARCAGLALASGEASQRFSWEKEADRLCAIVEASD